MAHAAAARAHVAALSAALSQAEGARLGMARLGELCAREPVYAAAAGDAGGATAALNALRLHPNDAGVAALGWALLALLCADSEGARAAARRVRALPELLAALATHADAPGVQAAACQALHGLGDAAAACAAGGVEALVAVLVRHSSRAGVAAHALQALRGLVCKSARNAARAHAAGAVAAAASALEAHTAVAAVTAPALDTLDAIMATCGTAIPPELRSSIQNAALAALCAHSTQEEAVARAGVCVMATLADAASLQQPLVGEAGPIVSAVLDAVRAWPDDGVLQTRGCFILHALLSAQPSSPLLAADAPPSFATAAAECATAALREQLRDEVSTGGGGGRKQRAMPLLQLLLALPAAPAAADAAINAGVLSLVAPVTGAHHRSSAEVKKQRRELFVKLGTFALRAGAEAGEDSDGGDGARAAAAHASAGP